MGHDLFTPNDPLMRPATNADWIDSLINLVRLGAMAVAIRGRVPRSIPED